MTARTRAGDRAKVSADNYFAMVPEWVLYAPISANAIRLYAVLARIANDATAEGFAKRQTLAERLSGRDGEPVSVKTVDRATSELEQLGAIEVVPQFDACGDRRENLYRVITRRPEVATPQSLGGDTTVPTPGHPCPDGGDTHVPTVATPVSLQGKQSPLTRAHEPEIAKTRLLLLQRARADQSEEEAGTALLHRLVARVEDRLGPGSLVAFWITSDTGGRRHLEAELADLLRSGWPEVDLIDELADGCYPGMDSPVAVLLERARALDRVPPDVAHRVASRDELHTRRLDAARRQAAVLAAADLDPADLRDQLCARYSDDGDALEAAFTSAGLDHLGRPREQVRL